MEKKIKALFAVIAILLLASIACLSSGDSGESDGGAPDLQATSESLEATQQAMSEQTQNQGEPESEEPESHPENADPVTGDSISEPIEPAASEGYDWDSYKSGDVVYQTEFNGTGEDWEDGWIHLTVPSGKENYSTWVKNGFLYVGIEETNTEVYLFYDPIYMPRGNADILVEAQTNNVGSVRNNNISVVCRATDDGWYEFSISSSGLWWIWKYNNETVTYDILAKGGVPNYNKNVTEHMLSASCIDDELSFYYDYNLLKNAQVNDSSYKEGGVGVSVYADNLSGVEVEFDWFEAQIP